MNGPSACINTLRHGQFDKLFVYTNDHKEERTIF